ncbi:MAG: hypothetical protein Q4C81_04115 [Kocuria sp.]|nr:hypothetical protein [Kocuria sp.]
MALEAQMLERLGQSAERLGQIREHLEAVEATQRRQLEAQDTQNLLAWMQLQQAQGREPDPHLVRIVRERLGV